VPGNEPTGSLPNSRSPKGRQGGVRSRFHGASIGLRQCSFAGISCRPLALSPSGQRAFDGFRRPLGLSPTREILAHPEALARALQTGSRAGPGALRLRKGDGSEQGVGAAESSRPVAEERWKRVALSRGSNLEQPWRIASSIACGTVPGMASSTSSSMKVRENRARRVAERRGLRLHKSRRRDPLALDFALWRVLDADGAPVAGFPPEGADLDALEKFLQRGRRGR
jgi:hypothetical protein